MENSNISINIGINFEWSLFYTTLCSYKSNSYLNDNIIKYGNTKLLEKLSSGIAESIRKPIPLSKDFIEFFDLVKKFQNFQLSLCSPIELDKFISCFSSKDINDKANFMLFKNLKTENTDVKCTFDLLSEQFGTFTAIHGSYMNRFYSILQNGLSLPKSSEIPGLFGSGIYLTNKLDIALYFAQAHLFNCGLFEGHSVKAVAVCEVIKHPNAVIRKKHSKSDGFSLSGDIPLEYFLVKDECMVRVTHVFIQSSSTLLNILDSIHFEQRIQVHQSNNGNIFLQIVRKHWLMFTIFIYVMILIIISFFTGRSAIFTDWETSDLLDINND